MQIHRNIEALPGFRNAVITIGTFDGVHEGHRKVIRQLTTKARAVNGESVIITFHPHPRKVVNSSILGLRLINTLDERIELLEALHARGGAPAVIVVTGHADVPLAIQAMKAGAVDFIEKPFDDEVILSAIRRAISDRAADADARAERNAIASRIATLSTRERQIMDRLVEGQANKAIAFDLGISARTVEVYRANAMMKMQAKTLSDLVRMATIARVGGV